MVSGNSNKFHYLLYIFDYSPLESNVVVSMQSIKYLSLSIHSSKQDVLTNDTTKQSAAVRLALGETQIVADTKSFLEEQGVILDAFSQAPSKRSKTVLLIKNLPVKTPIEEIRDMFAKHGELGRVVLPPNGITGLIEFYESSEAKNAFRRLAYTKYKGAPLYLEWAPEGTFKSKLKENKLEQKSNEADEKNENVESNSVANITLEDNTILFVKNLNFDTNDNELKEHCEQFMGRQTVHSATISR